MTSRDHHKINVVALNYGNSEHMLKTDNEKVKALKELIDQHYSCAISLNFGVKLCEVISDVAFCSKKMIWLNFRVIKEVNFYISHYGYDSLAQWDEYEKNLPTPFLTKDEADFFVSDYKVSIFKNMLLQAAKDIHNVFYHIINYEADDMIPMNIVRTMSIDKIKDLAPLVKNIVNNQAKETLLKSQFSTWDEWESDIKVRKKVIHAPEKSDSNSEITSA